MYTSDEKYEVILNSVADINMSNWQITKTLVQRCLNISD